MLSVAPLDGWWQALVAVPGAAVGQLVQLAMTGGAWSAGLGGLPAVLPAAVALIVWSVVFGWLAVRRFRWDPSALKDPQRRVSTRWKPRWARDGVGPRCPW